MIFSCKCIKSIWDITSQEIGLPITLSSVVLGKWVIPVPPSIQYITSVIAYTTYKFWLLCNDGKEIRNSEQYSKFVCSDLLYRAKVIRHIGDMYVSLTIENIAKRQQTFLLLRT